MPKESERIKKVSREEVYVTWRRAGIVLYIAVSLHHENFGLPFFFHNRVTDGQQSAGRICSA